MKLYLILIKNDIKAQFEYNISTYLLIVGQFIAQFTFIISFYLLFHTLGSIKGYIFSQALLVYSLINISYTCSEILGKGINNISDSIKHGDLDIFFLRPQPILLQAIGNGIEISRIGRLIQSIILFLVAMYQSQVHWNAIKVIAIILIPLGGIVLFMSLYIFFAAFAFFTIDSINISILLMGSGSDCLHYPANSLNSIIQKALTFIFPFSIINYYPFQYIFDKVNNPLLAFMPILSVSFMILILLFWKYSINKYSSTGS